MEHRVIVARGRAAKSIERRAVRRGRLAWWLVPTPILASLSLAATAAATFATQPYFGSDLLAQLTGSALMQSGLGNFSDYESGGSGAGELAMRTASPTQWTAPMSRMMSASVCSTSGGVTHASGIVIGVDALAILSQNNSGGVAACNGSADSAGAGLAYKASTGPAPFNDWRDVLALLYGGKDPQSLAVDCAGTARQVLVSNFSNLFQTACNNGVSTCTSATFQAGAKGSTSGYSIGGKLWHAFRLDDAAPEASVFADLLGLTPAIGASTLCGFGTSPFCNALNWDTSIANANCALGAHKQFLGPGGVPDPVAADGVHRRPPPGAWGDSPAQGASAAPDVWPTRFQDNDPIRRPCLGAANFVGIATDPAEEVCNLDGQLGLVLPIPAAPAPPNSYPANHCVSSTLGTPATAFTCPSQTCSTHAVCPDGGPLIGTRCPVPLDSSATSFCEADTSSCTGGPCSRAADARIYNLALFNGGTTGFVTATPGNVPFTGAFGRIHQSLPLWDTTPGSTGLADKGVACVALAAADQLGCLAQADPCSLSAGDATSTTWNTRVFGGPPSSGITALRVRQYGLSALNVQMGLYPVWTKLYFSSVHGFDQISGAVLFGGSNTALAELALGQFESNPSNIGPLLAASGFFPVGPFSPAGPDVPYCEDFNEQSLCGAPVNVNACANGALLPSQNPAAQTGAAFSPIPVASTVCGNGVVEVLEECDHGVVNGNPGDTCTKSCRSVLTAGVIAPALAAPQTATLAALLVLAGVLLWHRARRRGENAHVLP